MNESSKEERRKIWEGRATKGRKVRWGEGRRKKVVGRREEGEGMT